MVVDSELIKKCKEEFVTKDQSNHRYYSWHLCYQQFQKTFTLNTKLSDEDKEKLALILGFYLLSWGMGRNSKLMTEYNYQIHLGAIDDLFKYKDLPQKGKEWINGNGSESSLDQYVTRILALKACLTEYYKTIQPISVSPTDTLISKIILGALGCVPAYDEYFRKGLKNQDKIKYTYALNKESLKELWKFYRDNQTDLEELNVKLQEVNKEKEGNKNKEIAYTPMKLVDIYFWIKGYLSTV